MTMISNCSFEQINVLKKCFIFYICLDKDDYSILVVLQARNSISSLDFRIVVTCILGYTLAICCYLLVQ
jgi:hypothetical protein